MVVKEPLPLKPALKLGEEDANLGDKKEQVERVLDQTVRLCGVGVV
jgi:hypothetical protein